MLDQVERLAEIARDTPDWFGECILNDKGFPTGVVNNALVALRADPAVCDAIAYDEMECCVLLMQAIPGSNIACTIFPRPMTDEDITSVQSWMQRAGLKVSKDVAHQSVDAYAREQSFHPVRDYLNALVWDEVPRCENFFTSYFGADDTEYTRAIGPMFLKSMVARIFRPGCKADHVVILEGDQGTLKSTACSILGKRWFSDNLPDIGSKDASQHLRGKWLIEVSEMHAYTKAETAHLKAFITQTTERYRPSYGRKEVHEPRQVIFCGTTNQTDYLRDPTGGRRFWPVCCGDIRIDDLLRDRDQLFAEAVHRVELLKEDWWPDRAFELEHIRPEQDRRYTGDAWEGLIEPWLAGIQQTTILAVANGALELKHERIGRAEQLRISDILKRLGWTYGTRTKVAQFWVPK
jgi:predicted P-loop ATPase